jgi:phage shock protein PspC (stress-responsive transcriptional regulator)
MVLDPVTQHAGAMTTTPTPSSGPSSAPSSGESPADAPTDSSVDEGPRVTRDEVRDLGRLRRTIHDRKVAGVAGGLARHLDIDPLILRVGFVVLAFFGGAGLILYAAGWLLVPEEDRDRATVNLDERSRTIALVALGVIAALALVGDSWGADWFPWPLAIIGLIAFVWLSRHRDRDRRAPAPPAARSTAPGGEGGGESPATPAATRYVPRPRDPRKRGPVLFWFTLLLIGVAEGALGIADGAGAPVADSAYAALAVAVVAVMLLVGSVMGRAGGLIALGLVASVGLAAATAADRFDGDREEHHPTTADEVADGYTMDTGTLVVDLTEVSDLDGLDGRTLEVTGNVGEIVVRVPEEVSVRAVVDIDGPGGYDLFDRQTGGGFGSSTTAQHEGGADSASLVVDAALEVGQITVETE